ncbi:MAG: hypothetical protein ACRDR6_10170 [Pseudonocardiaceae bacterium]
MAQPPNAQNLEQAYVSVVRKVLPSVVQITTGHDLGSGIVFDTQGTIVTNAHVVGQYYPTTLPSSSSTAYHPQCTQRTSVTPPGCRSATSSWPWATHWG